MATQDDDTLTGAVPGPDAAPSPAELAHARRFAELVDKTLSGRTPPAMSADDRALLEVATVIRATHGNAAMAPATQHAVVEAALRQAVGAAAIHESLPGLVPAPSRSRRAAPWLVTGASTLAAAALAVLWLRAPSPGRSPHQARRALPVEWTSRPADSLIGPIARDHAGDAGARIDAIFADRLAGFRAQQLTRGGKP